MHDWLNKSPLLCALYQAKLSVDRVYNHHCVSKALTMRYTMGAGCITLQHLPQEMLSVKHFISCILVNLYLYFFMNHRHQFTAMGTWVCTLDGSTLKSCTHLLEAFSQRLATCEQSYFFWHNNIHRNCELKSFLPLLDLTWCTATDDCKQQQVFSNEHTCSCRDT